MLLSKEWELKGGGELRGGSRSREGDEEVYTKTTRERIPW